MEPVTHLLTGACLARTGLNRRAAYATLTMVVAAEFPDIDTLWSLRGPVAGFEHHRGITHTFLGLPLEAALLVALVYGLHRWRLARASLPGPVEAPDRTRADSRANRASPRPTRGSPGPMAPPPRAVRPLTAAPVRWGWLYCLALLALLSHLLLDYTNNYGLRPFYPFNSHWYAASIVFIFDPLMFAMLLAGLVAPALFGLVSSEVGVRRPPFRGRGWAIAALLGVLSLWTLREVEHSRALRLALTQSIAAPAAQSAPSPAQPDPSPVQPTPNSGPLDSPGALAPPEPPVTYLKARRALANPDPLSPFQWPSVIDFGPVYRLTEIDTRTATLRPAETFEPKPARTPAVLAAEASPLGRFYMNWSPMPFVTVAQPSGAAANSGAAEGTVVIFRDPRFMGKIPLLPSSGRSPLTASVSINAKGEVARQSMGVGDAR